jgi:hypothetical protein
MITGRTVAIVLFAMAFCFTIAGVYLHVHAISDTNSAAFPSDNWCATHNIELPVPPDLIAAGNVCFWLAAQCALLGTLILLYGTR